MSDGDSHLTCDNPECNRCIPCGYCRCSSGFMLYSMAKMVAAFVEELRLDGVEWSLGELDKFSGRYVFTLRYCGRVLEGLMPGLPGAEVRFYNRPDQDIFSFPRLFLQGSSWCWIWAVQLAREEFVEAAKRGGYSR